jgi:hypothetical protein
MIIQHFADIFQTLQISGQAKFVNCTLVLGQLLLPTEFPPNPEMVIHPLLKRPLSLLASRIA